MVSGARIDDMTRKMIRSIKDIVGNHSDDDIFEALKESSMDPDETVQRLLNQDPFREVKRKRDRKKEVTNGKGPDDQSRETTAVGRGMKFLTFPNRNLRRGGYTRTAVHGTNKEFRVVRDNRANLNMNGEFKTDGDATGTEKGSMRIAYSQQPSGAQSLIRNAWHNDGASSGGSGSKDAFAEKQTAAPNVVSKPRASKPNNSYSATTPSNTSGRVYASSSDPVHVPSPDSRSYSAGRAIRREVGAVGASRLVKEGTVNDSSAISNPPSRKQSPPKSHKSFIPGPKVDRSSQMTVSDAVASSKTFSSSQHGNRYSQYGNRLQAGIHHKAPPPNKEWKPKLSQKLNVTNPGIIGTPKRSASPPVNRSAEAEFKAGNSQGMQEKLSRLNISDNQNVIIPQHIRVPESDRCGLTFGSFGPDFECSQRIVSGFQEVDITEEADTESATSLSVSAPVASGDDTAGSKPIDVRDDQIWHSGSDSPVTKTSGEQQLLERKESSGPQNMDDYADIGLIHNSAPSYPHSGTKQHQHPPELQSFPAYDPENAYDALCFRHTIEDTVRGQGLVSPQEGSTSQAANSIPASSISMLQQQPPPVAQMYPQVHVSHFGNLMPFRQYVSPVYVPQMAMPGYSGNAAYPHPSNGSNYLLMPGGSSHLSANGIKYGIQQFKPVPTGNATGFGSFTNPPGYPVSNPGVVGNATGLEDSSRVKFKDGNIYVPNPLAENAEIWIQNPRELQGLQSPPYYNMPGQSPHAAYLPPHTGHASFNPAAAPQSSHMQYPGVFHPPQPAPITTHHLGPAMGGNVGVGMAPPTPGAQVGAYQQPQLGHMNWATNF